MFKFNVNKNSIGFPIGAIVGDIVGSRFEFNNIKTKDFELFDHTLFGSRITDDTVMTVAVARALAQYDEINDYKKFKKIFVRMMRKICGRYPLCGYKRRLDFWFFCGQTRPPNVYSNGLAMRVSPVAWYGSSLEEVIAIAKVTAEEIYNLPEGIVGAQAVAGATYLARMGKSKDEIKEFVSKYYSIDFTLDEIRPTYRFDVTCRRSVPQAFVAFFESTDFEDAIRNAVSIGGDSDTIAAMTGAIAEAYYGVPKEIEEAAVGYLDEYLLKVIRKCI